MAGTSKTCSRAALEKLATKCVGINTNLSFVSVDGLQVAVFSSERDARAFAETQSGNVLVEGWSGEVWANETYRAWQRKLAKEEGD